MNEPAVLWPLPWWTSAIAVGAIVFGSWIAARLALKPRNRRALHVAQQLREAGFASAVAYELAGDKNAAVVSGERIALIDMRDGRVVQTLRLDDTTGLKIYDASSSSIPFRFVGRNGAQSRKVMTRSVIEFARLFGLMAGASKKIEYIEE